MEEAAKQTQRDECYRSLRRMLLHGQVPPGKRITETVWSQQLGVTRGSLREAMSMLLHEGLLLRGRRGGFFAPVINRHDYEEVMEVRFAIEVGALRLMGMKRVPAANLPKLRETCDVMERMLEETLELGFAEADRRFHELLVEVGQNERLRKVYSRAPLPFLLSGGSDRELRRAGFWKTLSEHRRICELLEQQNISEACKVLERHLFSRHPLAKAAAERNRE